jgi:hypothetical protein
MSLSVEGMLVEFTFYPYTEKHVSMVEKRWGIYRLADASKKLLFLGKGNVLKHLGKHLPGAEAEAPDAAFFSVEYFDTYEEARSAWEDALAEHVNKHGTYPKYNKAVE